MRQKAGATLVALILIITLIKINHPQGEEIHPPSLYFKVFSSTRTVTSFLELSSGCLIGTTGGLVIIDSNCIRSKVLLPGIPVRAISEIPEKTDCALIASDYGLYQYKDGETELILNKPVTSVIFLDDMYITGHPDGQISWYREGALVKSLQVSEESPINHLVFYKDSLFAGSINGLWKISGEKIEDQFLSRNLLSKNITDLKIIDEKIYAGTAMGLFCWAEGDWAKLDYNLDCELHINSILSDSSGELMVGSAGDGIYLLKENNFIPLEGSPEYITGLLWYKGFLFAGTPEDGVWKISLSEERGEVIDIKRLYQLNCEVPGNDITSLTYVAAEKTLYVGTFDHGLGSYCGGRWKHMNEEGGFYSNWINQTGTDGKRPFVRFSDGNVFTYENEWRQAGKRPDGWPKNWTSAVGNDKDTLWVGTYSAFYLYKEEEWQIFVPKPELHGKLVMDIALKDDEIWIGTHKHGLYLWKDEENSWENYSLNRGLSDSWVTNIEIFLDKVWVGTFSGGLCCLDSDNKWQVYNREGNNLPSNRINCMLATDNALWIGTLEGLTWTDGENWYTYDGEDGLLSTSIRSLSADGKYLWIGTDEGLYRASFMSKN